MMDDYQVLTNGGSLVDAEDPNAPQLATKLIGNYPNPFNPTTKISFSLQHDSKVELSVFNIKGQKITTLLNENMTAGKHNIAWNGVDSNNKKVSSGVYFYKMESSKYTNVKKMILLK